VAKSGPRPLPSQSWLQTASSTVRRESWWASVVWSSRPEQSSLWTEFDPTLESPGSWETSVLGLRVAGKSELLCPLMIAHLQTASRKLRLPLPIVVCPESYHPTPVIALRLFLPLSEFSRLPPAPVSAFVTVVRTSNGCTAGAGTVVIACNLTNGTPRAGPGAAIGEADWSESTGSRRPRHRNRDSLGPGTIRCPRQWRGRPPVKPGPRRQRRNGERIAIHLGLE